MLMYLFVICNQNRLMRYWNCSTCVINVATALLSDELIKWLCSLFMFKIVSCNKCMQLSCKYVDCCMKWFALQCSASMKRGEVGSQMVQPEAKCTLLNHAQLIDLFNPYHSHRMRPSIKWLCSLCVLDCLCAITIHQVARMLIVVWNDLHCSALRWWNKVNSEAKRWSRHPNAYC